MRQRKAKVGSAARSTVGYVRVSTDDQSENGVSLDSQEARLRAYSAAMAWDGLEVAVDAGESAKTLARPALAVLLDRVRRGEVVRVVVCKLDRLTRSMRDLADLLDLFARHGVALVSIGESLDTSTAAGRLVLNMLGTVAQWEREIVAERTAGALRHLRQNRRAYGPTPFGYVRIGNDLVPDRDEQSALAEAVRLDRAGASYREIGRTLTALGAKPHRGAAWHPSCVRAVLRSRSTAEAIPAA